MSKKRRRAPGAERMNRNAERTSRRSKKNRLGVFCIILQTILSLAFMVVVLFLDMLPMRYLAMIALILFFFWCITLNSQVARKKRGAIGKIFSLLVVCFLSIGTYYIAKTNDVIGMITSGSYRVDNMVVAVLADDPAQALEDAADYSFGIQLERGAENMRAAVTDIQDELGTDIDTVEYDSIQAQAQALHDGEVDAIVYNEAYTDILEEGFEGYKDSVRIIYTHEIRVEMNFGGNASDDSLTKEPFTVYISGIDVYGEVSQTSRSDVNIIAVVNPNTNQVLLVTTPRDYYVEIPGISEGQEDKLTHAGIYGIDASMATLSELYETDINYYVRLNFTSLIEIVDILGGVDVYSDMAFTTGWESGYEMDVQEGWNHFNGEQALAFSRERKSLPDGDNQRGIHQQAVITAMLKKVLSPTMLLKANSILNQVSKDVETNISQAQLNSLIKYQLGKNPKWSIRSVAATGTEAREYCYSAQNQSLYVTIPDYDVVNEIIDLVNVVEEGGTLEKAEDLN